MYRSSVEKSTRKTYKTAEKYWVKLTKRIGTDPYMRTKNPAWLAGDTSFANTTITWEETCVLAFLESTRHKPRKLTPNTAFNYLSAIRKFLQDGGVATDFMSTSQYIKNTKAAMKIAYRIETGITVKDTVRMPVSMDMIQGHHAATQRREYTVIDLAVYTAQVLAFTTLSRVSEYLYTGESGTHTLMSEDVQFEMLDGSMVPSHAVGTKKYKNVNACIVNIRSAKNDAAGRGHRYFFNKCNPATDKSTYCITWILWRYVQHARPGSRLPFFHIPKLKWTLKPTYLNKKLQAMAKMYGLDPSRVSSHSLRIGGATAMAAAGMSEYEIKQMGGWKSDVFLDYARNTTQLFERARSALAKKSFTIQSTRRLNPGCASQRRTKQ